MGRLLLAILLLAPAAAAAPVAIEPTGDAEADAVAVSGTKDAHSSCSAFGTIPCAAVSGTGNASGSSRVEGAHLLVCPTNGFGTPHCLVNGDDDQEVASASLEGHAEGGAASLAPTGRANGSLVAVGRDGARGSLLAVGGDADGTIAVSTGQAHGIVAVGAGEARGFIAASAAGDAEAEGCLATPLDPCHEGVAVDLEPEQR
ncbi:MAG TPA: hypothetical protein VM370_08905 [Candidatus Thermoplasmatota archaeon]|nr:hypothetical protein [Candidatus Thermoplasmatota archaeon]